MRVVATRGGLVVATLVALLSTSAWAAASDLLAPTNVARNTNLVQSLTLNAQLTAAAEARLANMQANHYFGHVQPDGTSFGEAATAAGYNWRGVAENLACGFNTPQSVIDAWMGSPGHRANLLSATYREVGFAQGVGTCGTGQALVSVAIYGTTVSGSATPLPAPAPAPSPSPAPSPAAAPKTPAKPASPTPVATPAPSPSPAPTPTKASAITPAQTESLTIPAARPVRVTTNYRQTGPFAQSKQLLWGALALPGLGWLLLVLAKVPL